MSNAHKKVALTATLFGAGVFLAGAAFAFHEFNNLPATIAYGIASLGTFLAGRLMV